MPHENTIVKNWPTVNGVTDPPEVKIYCNSVHGWRASTGKFRYFERGSGWKCLQIEMTLDRKAPCVNIKATHFSRFTSYTAETRVFKGYPVKWPAPNYPGQVYIKAGKLCSRTGIFKEMLEMSLAELDRITK